MRVEPVKIITTIKMLNDSILRIFPESEYDLAPQFEYRTDGRTDTIFFMDLAVWSSENDERNENEPLRMFLERKVPQRIQFISQMV